MSREIELTFNTEPCEYNASCPATSRCREGYSVCIGEEVTDDVEQTIVSMSKVDDRFYWKMESVHETYGLVATDYFNEDYEVLIARIAEETNYTFEEVLFLVGDEIKALPETSPEERAAKALKYGLDAVGTSIQRKTEV
jgi:hypothetical protein